MRKPVIFIAVSLVIVAITSASLLSVVKDNKTTDLNSTKEMKVEDVIKYKNSYVGDNSAVSNILRYLPGGTFEKGISLDTETEPYGIEVNYGLREGSDVKEQTFKDYWTEEATEKIFLNNATALFTLVKNVDKVTFNLEIGEGKTLTITRKELETFYGKDLRTYGDNTSLWKSEVLEGTIASKDKLKDFFKAHNINTKKTKVEVF